MKILNRKQLSSSFVKPTGATRRLALGAMTIATGIVGDAAVTAAVTRLDMATQLRGPTPHEVAEDAALLD
jgi:hypothetical protein